jgi:hypothetical protein
MKSLRYTNRIRLSGAYLYNWRNCFPLDIPVGLDDVILSACGGGEGSGVGRDVGRFCGCKLGMCVGSDVEILFEIGLLVGSCDGKELGRCDGQGVGRLEGIELRFGEGFGVGRCDGRKVSCDGLWVCSCDGRAVGRFVGAGVSRGEGTKVGRTVGRDHGSIVIAGVGFIVGNEEAAAVGLSEGKGVTRVGDDVGLEYVSGGRVNA